MSYSELYLKTAVELARMIRTREVSCMEVTEAHITRIEALNPKINAICTFLPDAARAEAREADARLGRDIDTLYLRSLWFTPSNLPLFVEEIDTMRIN